MMRRLLPVLVAGAALSAAAQPATPRTEIEAGAEREHLTRGLPDWSSRFALIEHRDAQGRVAYGGWRDTERYRLRDHELHAGGYLPLAPSLQLQAEAGASGSHRVLSRHYGLVGLHFQPAQGWGLSGGMRRAGYDAGNTGVINLGVEHYTGNERFAYTLFAGGPDGAALASTHRLQWNHYYGDHDWFGIAIAEGRETEHDGSGAFITSRVRNFSLAGRHGLGKGLALKWEAGRQRQGELYTRSGLRLGLRFAF